MDREALRRQLVRHEGIRLRMYPDTATPQRWTIGIGHNLTDRGISLAIANALYNEDVQAHWTDLTGFYPAVASLDDVRQRVLMDMCFALGIGELKQFRKMWAAVRARDWARAAIEILDSDFARQVGARATRLAEMMRTGLDPA